jgi:hypothetical protein
MGERRTSDNEAFLPHFRPVKGALETLERRQALRSFSSIESRLWRQQALNKPRIGQSILHYRDWVRTFKVLEVGAKDIETELYFDEKKLTKVFRDKIFVILLSPKGNHVIHKIKDRKLRTIIILEKKYMANSSHRDCRSE